MTPFATKKTFERKPCKCNYNSNDDHHHFKSLTIPKTVPPEKTQK